MPRTQACMNGAPKGHINLRILPNMSHWVSQPECQILMNSVGISTRDHRMHGSRVKNVGRFGCNSYSVRSGRFQSQGPEYRPQTGITKTPKMGPIYFRKLPYDKSNSKRSSSSRKIVSLGKTRIPVPASRLPELFEALQLSKQGADLSARSASKCQLQKACTSS